MSSKFEKLVIMIQVDPPSYRPWRIVEVYDTCDGPRTRVASGTWKTLEEVFNVVQGMRKKEVGTHEVRGFEGVGEDIRDKVLEEVASWYERTGYLLDKENIARVIRGMKSREGIVLGEVEGASEGEKR